MREAIARAAEAIQREEETSGADPQVKQVNEATNREGEGIVKGRPFR